MSSKAFYFAAILVFLVGSFQARAQDAPADTVAAVAADTVGVEVIRDEALQNRIQAVFSNIQDFENIQVEVNEGVVRLTGKVPGSEAEDEAEALAARFDGVLYVDNQLDEATDVETRVSPAVERVQALWNRFVANLPAFAVALLVLLFFGLLARFVMRWEAPFQRLGVSPLVSGLLRRLFGTVLFGVGLVLALDILDVTALVGAVLGTAGVVGLALGFAFQDIVENYLAGVLLSVRQPFAVGDLVDVGDRQGKVIRLTAREMVMMTIDGNHLRLPNATVFKSAIVNYTRNPRRRFSFTVGVSNDLELGPVQVLGRETIGAMPGILDDPPPTALVQALADSSVTIQFTGWVDQRQADFLKARSEALRLVKAAFDEAGYEMPEPIYRVNLQQMKPPPEATAPRAEETHPVDVAPETEIDEQIREDLAASDEQNLLDE